jgi:hypothetical protein
MDFGDRIEDVTVTVEIPPSSEAAIQAEARARGVSVESWLVQLAEESARGAGNLSVASLQITDPDEWVRQFDLWMASHDPATPVLADRDMSRESIYPD